MGTQSDLGFSQTHDELALTSRLYSTRLLEPESPDVIQSALQRDAVARRILAKGVCAEPNQLVGVRLNINVMRSTGVAVHSIHRATSKDGHASGRGFYRGEVIHYLPVVQLRDAYFNVHQGGREGIASGTMAKHPMASIDGQYQPIDGPANFDGVEVRFNPKLTHLFVDNENFAVQYAQEVTILGNRAFARGLIRYFKAASAPKRAGDANSIAMFKS